MKIFRMRRAFSIQFLTTLCAVLLIGTSAAAADDKKPPAPPKAAPAKPPAAAPGHGAANTTHGPTSTTHGPTTTAHGPNTASRNTTATNHGATTTSHPANANNHVTTTNRSANSVVHSESSNRRDVGKDSSARKSENAGRVSRPLPKGHTEIHSRGGSSFTKRPNGRVATVHDERRHMDIHHDLHGGRRVDVRRGDRRIVAERGGRGFVERPYRFHGREYGQRTYYYNGRAYDHFYHGYYYRGAFVQMYTPAYYYAPAFYGWAFNPWLAPVPYAWGWGGNPWYGYYGAYFAPYPVYPSASYWLTDYLISTTLASAYEARAAEAAQAQDAGAVALTPQVKNLISEEVQRQIAIENAESSAGAQNADPNPAMSGVQAMLSDNVRHVFVAGRSIDVVDGSGAECAISDGDALQLSGPPPAGATSATLIVLSSKGGQDCRAGKTVSVEVADLQDMQNHMRETVDQGMSELQTKQGRGGLPPLPRSASAPPVKAAFAADAPPPDASAAKEIAEQSKEADQAENDVIALANSEPGSANPDDRNTVATPVPFGPLGKGIPEVIAHYGQPMNIVDLGAKKIYVYKELKITFKDEKVVDVQ